MLGINLSQYNWLTKIRIEILKANLFKIKQIKSRFDLLLNKLLLISTSFSYTRISLSVFPYLGNGKIFFLSIFPYPGKRFFFGNILNPKKEAWNSSIYAKILWISKFFFIDD